MTTRASRDPAAPDSVPGTGPCADPLVGPLVGDTVIGGGRPAVVRNGGVDAEDLSREPLANASPPLPRRTRGPAPWRAFLLSACCACTGVTSTRAEPVALPELHPPRTSSAAHTSIGDGWRHSFDIVLTASGERLVVHDAMGGRHVFEPTSARSRRSAASTGSPRTFRSRTRAAERLVELGRGHLWLRASGERVVFDGSLPVLVARPRAAPLRLVHERGMLRSVWSDDSPGLHFNYDVRGRLKSVVRPDGAQLLIERADDRVPRGRVVELTATRRSGPRSSWSTTPRDDVDGPTDLFPTYDATGTLCLPDHENGGTEPLEDESGDGRDDDPSGGTTGDADEHLAEPERCDTRANPPPASFTAGPGIVGAHRIDARPASCRSYFTDHVGTDRGFAIEAGLADVDHHAGYERTVRSFPIADFVGDELRVVRSRDLALPAYDTRPDGLLDRLLADGRAIVSTLLEPLERDGRVSVTELGRTTTLEHDAARPVVLELVVRHGMASADQVRQIELARVRLFALHGIRLRVIEIP